MKKFISLLLTLILCLSLMAPAVAYAATIKLNKSKLELTIDETYDLKIIGSSKKVKWSSSDNDIVKVSSAGKIKGIDAGDATITATVGGKKYTCKVSVGYDIDTMLYNTYDWVVGIWNDGFCNTYHYIENGLDAIGQEMDIDETIKKTDKYMEEFEKYDKFIKSLSDDDYYEDLNELWPKLAKEIKYLYGRIKEETPRASDESYEFKYSKFNEYMYELMDVIY
jgi:hypothetical protein